MKKILQILLIIALGAFSLGITSCNANVNATDRKDTVEIEMDFSQSAINERAKEAAKITKEQPLSKHSWITVEVKEIRKARVLGISYHEYTLEFDNNGEKTTGFFYTVANNKDHSEEAYLLDENEELQIEFITDKNNLKKITNLRNDRKW